MPYKSDAQRRFMHAKHPEIARKWDAEIRAKKKVKKSLEPVFKAAPGFNAKAAQAAFDLVMKMDEDEAREFTSIVVADVLEETIEKNLVTLQKRLNTVVEKRMERVKKALIRKAAQDPEWAKPYAEAISVIEKAKNPYQHGYVWNERDFRRDPSTGRFQAKVKPMELSRKQAEGMGIPNRAGIEEADKKRYRGEYLQLSQFLGAVHESTTNPGDQEILLHLQNKNGQRYTTRQVGTKPDTNLWDPTYERLVGVEARPTTLTAGGAAFGLTAALGASPEASRNVARTTNAADHNFGSFATEFTNASYSPERPNDQLYGRLTAGSRFLGQVAPAGSKAQMAAAFGQFVGSHGPEAEAVVGPAARKTAYRYRGTEKTPDSEMVRAYETAVRGAMQRDDFDQDRRTRIRAAQTRALNDARRAKAQEMQAQGKSVDLNAIRLGDEESNRIRNEVARKFQGVGAGRKPNEEELAAGREAIANHLQNKVAPNKRLYNLQLASGNTPPSEGVMINSEGQIVAQAVGYGDDHYLPFNLKNLKGLKGGEYIRNRSVGGPTSEDIYTGLMAGANRITVVSRSGTFTVNFEDDFRGGRRHNDKARRMVRRYEQLLDAVQSQQVDRMDVEPVIRNAIAAEVKEEAHPATPRSEIQAEITRRIDEYKSNPDLDEQDEARAERIVRVQGEGLPENRRNQLREQIYNQIAADKEYKYRLNGEGYSAALQALQEQFPYYITVDPKPTREMDRFEPNIDRGYVEPGRNRPTAARAGLYGTSVNAGRKISASQADYQGARAERRGGTPDGGPGETQGELQRVPGKDQPDLKKEIRTQKVQSNYTDAAVELRNLMRERLGTNVEGMREVLSIDNDEDFRKYLGDPDKQRDFNAWVNANATELAKDPMFDTALGRYKAAAGWVGRAPFQKELAYQWNREPYSFDGDAYEMDASAESRAKEMNRVKGDMIGLVNKKPLSTMTDAELEREVQIVGRVRRQLKEAGDNLPWQQKQQILAGIPTDSPSMEEVGRNTDSMDSYLERVHRVRALNSGVPETDRRAASAKADEGDIVLRNPGQADFKNKVDNLKKSVSSAMQYAENEADTDNEEIRRLRWLQDELEQAEISNEEDLESFNARYDVKNAMATTNRVFERKIASQRNTS